jgi:16S rRNA (cytidine1402-2'-O)-methyltransferase
MRTTLAQAIAYYGETAPKGEYVLVIEGCPESKTAKTDYPEDITEHVSLLMENGLSKMDAIKACAKARGVAKSVVYNEINGD